MAQGAGRSESWQPLEEGIRAWDWDGPFDSDHGLLRLHEELVARRELAAEGIGTFDEWDLRAHVATRLLLAAHRDELAIDLPSAGLLGADAARLLVARFGQVEGTEQGLYLAVTLSTLLHGVSRLREAEYVARWALDSFPLWSQQPSLAVELLRLCSVIQSDGGEMREARETLQRMEAFASIPLAEEHPSDQALLLEARMHTAWADHWIEVGVLDLARRRLDTAFERMERSGGFLFQVLQSRLELLLRVGAVDELLATIGRWRERYASGLAQDPRALRILRFYEAVALVDAERADPARERRARGIMEQLVAETEGSSDFDRLTLRLYLCDIAMSEGRLEDAAAELEAARALRGEQNQAWSSLCRAHEARLALAREAGRDELVALRGALEEDVRRLLASWSSAQRVTGGIGFLQRSSRRQVLSALVELTLRTADGQAGVERAIEWLLEAQARGSLARDLGVEQAPSLRAVREGLLAEGHGVLLLLTAKQEGSHLFAFDARSALHVRLPGLETLHEPAARLEGQLAVHPASIPSDHRDFVAGQLESASRELSAQVLVPEVERLLLGWRAVTFVGWELLTSAPPEGLLLSDGRQLGHALAVDSAPSLPVALAIAGREEPRFSFELGLIGMLSSVDDPRVRPLAAGLRLESRPIESVDVERLLRPFPEGKTWSLLEDRATLENVLRHREELRDTRTVHFLVHGVWRAGEERGACLVLAAGEGDQELLLDCETVEEQLSFRGNVLLSACGTALGPQRLGDDELAHLGSALLRAGARCVVLSRAPLAYRRTLELSASIHGFLAQGLPVAEALRRARVALRSEDDPLAAWMDLQVRAVGVAHDAPTAREGLRTSGRGARR